jgi:hypothetical protein
MGIKLHSHGVHIDQHVAKQVVHVLGIIARAGGPKSIFATLTGEHYSPGGHAMAVAMARSVLETNDLLQYLEKAEPQAKLAPAVQPPAAPNLNDF